MVKLASNSMPYLDWNATTPPLPEVLDAMRDAARAGWANPSSIHAHGRAARAHVEDARAAVADLAGVDPRDVVLTSGGTEANNLAIRSAFATPGTLVTSRLEHPSVTRVAEALAREGKAHLHWLEVRPDGRIDLEDLAAVLALPATPRLLVLQAVNHETGVIQPLAEAFALAQRYGVRVHVDAIQAFGRIAASADDLGAATRSLAAHKLRGPKGIGALVTRASVRLEAILLGGAQERGLRPGTLDPIAAAGLAVAARHAKTGAARYARLAPMRDDLERALLALAAGPQVVGTATRAPHVSNLTWPGWIGAELVAALDLEGLSVSSGSACSAGTIEPSPVVLAMLGPAVASSSVRVSLGEDTTPSEIAAAIAIFKTVTDRMNSRSDHSISK